VADARVVVREPGRVALHLVITEPLQLGRDCAGLLLNDPQISRVHLELRIESGSVVVEDLGSTNGSTIDGQPLTSPQPLTLGSVVTMGDTTVRLYSDFRSTVIAGELVVPVVDLRKTSIDMVADAVAESPPDLTTSGATQGTVTIVFSDIESSTARAEQLGDEDWFSLLSKHNSIVRTQVRIFGGTEIKAQGDGFMLTFPSARSAVQCMVAVQQDLAAHNDAKPDERVMVRVGLHTGEAIADNDGDLFGKHVIVAARVANEAVGGEILVSSLVHEIIEARGDIEFGESRASELKGLTGIHTMFPIRWS
jgi:adenylate cyclase